MLLISILFLANNLASANETIISAGCQNIIKPISTQHTLTLSTVHLNYTATVGEIPIYNAQHECVAAMSYIAYTLNSQTKRPITFFYNGGPGAASIDLNFLATGPKIVRVNQHDYVFKTDDTLSNNQQTWLRFTDQVFLDAIGTGWGRVFNKKDKNHFYNVKNDAAAFAQAIHNYIAHTNRWNSPLFLAGESYGGFRTAGIIQELFHNYGIKTRAAIMISPLYNLFDTDNGQIRIFPFIFSLPTYTATSLYYDKLSTHAQKNPLITIAKAKEWADTVYLAALLKGDNLSQQDQAELLKKLQYYTGLPKNLILHYRYRIPINKYEEFILSKQHKTIGNLDTRFSQSTHDDSAYYSASLAHNAMLTQVDNQISAIILSEIHSELGVSYTPLRYIFDSKYIAEHWQWLPTDGLQNPHEPEMISTLRNDFANLKSLRLFNASGYYDLATPFMTQKFALSQLELSKKQKQHVIFKIYDSGHMVYISKGARVNLYNDVRKFYKNTLKNK